MKTQSILKSLLIIFLSAAFSYSQTSYTFDAGINAAKSGNKKIFVDIYSPSDNWSKKMDSDIYSAPSVQSALSNFVFVKLNGDGNEKYSYGGKTYSSGELAKLFGGTGYPTFVVLNSDGSVIKFKYNGEEVSNISGFIGADDFVEMLNYFARGDYGIDLSSIFKN